MPPIEVGLLYNKGADAAAGSLGFKGISFGDQGAEFQTVVADVNAHGGIGGRRVVAVLVAQDSSSTESWATQEQAWCAQMTQDHHVALAASIIGSDDKLTSCLAEHGVPSVNRWTGGSTAVYRRWASYLYSIAEPPLDSGLVASAQALDERHWFEGAKVGILYYATPDDTWAKDQLVGYLHGRGIDVAQQAGVDISSSDAGQSAFSNAVLHFGTSGVTHVICVCPGGGVLFFMTDAESQHYRPKYGLNSFDQPAALTSLVPSAQLQNASGEGWAPLLDLAFDEQPPANAEQKRCLALHAAAGRTFSDGVGEGFAIATCDALWFMQDAARGSGAVDNRSFQTGVNHLDGIFSSGLTLQTSFADHRTFGPAALRDLDFVSGCTCFRYAGSTTHPM